MLVDVYEFIARADAHRKVGKSSTARPANVMPECNARIILQRNPGIIQSAAELGVVIVDEVLRVPEADSAKDRGVYVHQTRWSVADGYWRSDAPAFSIPIVQAASQPIAEPAATIPAIFTIAQVCEAGPRTMP